MRLLLDTHTFLWSISQPSKLPSEARSAIEDALNEAFVSAVSLWEIAIKVRIGKLELGSNHDLIAAASKTGIQTIPLEPDEAGTYLNLSKDGHNDPFDRMLIWQAICRDMTLISGDTQFNRFVAYGLKLLWK